MRELGWSQMLFLSMSHSLYPSAVFKYFNVIISITPGFFLEVANL